MDLVVFRFGLWVGVLGVVLAVGGYALWYLRRRLLTSDDDESEEVPLYTTAAVERLKSEGQIDEAQYAKLMSRVREAAKTRARKQRERRNSKRAIFG